MSNTINQKAIALLGQAGFDYPTTREETLQMQSLLKQAWEAAEDREETEFKDKYDRLGEIVQWSLARHRTWQWPVIAGALLFAALLLWGGLSNKDEIQHAKESIKQIKAWEPCDTLITWESCKEFTSDAERHAAGEHQLENANNWKSYELSESKARYLQNMATVASNREKAQTETDSEKKSNYLKQADYWEKYSVKYKETFDKIAPMEYSDVKKEAVAQAKIWLSHARGNRNFFIVNFILVLILCGLYVWSGNPYGYNITAARTRHKILGWIRKIGFWFAGLCLGSGIAAKLFADDIVWKYADGHTERESDVAGTAGNVVWKIILIVIGVIAFIAVAGIVMFLETAFSLPVKLREQKPEKG
ncbi:MAG: hypothetical protein IJ222_10300 [Bacteroidales bacterium]|nr:hypothetical protein [Bacteroidales bacterium]